MFLITIINWKHKTGIMVRLLLFLLLIALITPQFFNFISGHIASFKSRSLENQPPAFRVEQRVDVQQKSVQNQGDLFLKKLQEYYFGSGKQAPTNSE